MTERKTLRDSCIEDKGEKLPTILLMTRISSEERYHCKGRVGDRTECPGCSTLDPRDVTWARDPGGTPGEPRLLPSVPVNTPRLLFHNSVLSLSGVLVLVFYP